MDGAAGNEFVERGFGCSQEGTPSGGYLCVLERALDIAPLYYVLLTWAWPTQASIFLRTSNSPFYSTSAILFSSRVLRASYQNDLRQPISNLPSRARSAKIIAADVLAPWESYYSLGVTIYCISVPLHVCAVNPSVGSILEVCMIFQHSVSCGTNIISGEP